MDRGNPAEADSGPVAHSAPTYKAPPVWVSRKAYEIPVASPRRRGYYLKRGESFTTDVEFPGRKYFHSSSVDDRLILTLSQHP